MPTREGFDLLMNDFRKITFEYDLPNKMIDVHNWMQMHVYIHRLENRLWGHLEEA